MPWAVICPAVPNKKAGFPVEETGLDFQTVNPERGTGRSISERELQHELHHAGASRADQRIAGRDVGRACHHLPVDDEDALLKYLGPQEYEIVWEDLSTCFGGALASARLAGVGFGGYVLTIIVG